MRSFLSTAFAIIGLSMLCVVNTLGVPQMALGAESCNIVSGCNAICSKDGDCNGTCSSGCGCGCVSTEPVAAGGYCDCT
jgi:hypothetical protein